MSRPRTTRRVALVAALAVVSMTAAGWAQPAVTAISNVAIVDVEQGRLLPNRTVLVRGDRIDAVIDGPSPAVPASARVIDGTGKFLMPGLWDMHVHVNARALPVLLRYGITGVRDMGGDLRELTKWRTRIAADPLEGPRLVFSGPLLAGPPATPDDDRWIVTTPEEAARAVSALKAAGADSVKVHEGLSRDVYLAILEAAKQSALPVAGHVPATLMPDEVSAAGQKAIEHLEFVPDACLPMFQRTARATGVPAAPGCSAADLDVLLAGLARRGTWLTPTISGFRAFVPPGDFRAILEGFAELVGPLRRHRLSILAGTDASGGINNPPGPSLHDELARLVAAGFTPPEALSAATLAPARYLGLEAAGRIAPGAPADLVLLGDDPLADIRHTTRIVAVIRAGRFLDVRLRARDLGVEVGVLPAGRLNAITDVSGVRVGHATVIRGDDVRTGATAILPHGGNLFQEKVPGAVVVGNGFGKLMGSTQVKELGEIETPILLTSTLSVPRTADALIEWMLALPGNEEVRSVNPLVGETNDGYLNDGRGRHVGRAEVRAAIESARGGWVEEGNVGAGTGTIAFGFKGGIGTASRVVPESLGGYTVGVLVQSNFGGVLTIGGAPVGRELGRFYLREQIESAAPKARARDAGGPPDRADGSIIVVVATDAPLDARNLERLAARALLGVARTGSAGSNGSGDYAIAFSTAAANRVKTTEGPRTSVVLGNESTSPLFLAAIEATEEAIYNSLFRAGTMTGRDGHTVEALPLDRVLAILRKYNVLGP